MADKNPIYDYLKSEGMTDLSEQDFVNKYSDREQLQPVYDWLKENGNTDLEFEPFADKYFPSPKSSEVSGQGSTATSATSTGASQPSQNTNFDQATLAEQSTGVGYVLPEGAVDLTNPEQGIYAYYDPNLVNVDTGEMGDVVNRLEAVEVVPTMDESGEIVEEPVTVLESIKNSFKNVGTQLRGFDDRAVLTSTGAFSWLFGEDLARKVYNFLEVTSDRTFDSAREEAVAELEILSEEMLPTLGIVDSWQERSLPGVVAGVVNGATSMLSTIVTAIPTLGGGIGIDVIGGSFENYNNAKAESLGITTQELYDTKQADFGTPLLIGAVGTALEAVGLRGVTNSITSKLTSSVAKRMSVLGLDMNKEGMTEWTQYGLEQYGNAKAIGASESEAINALANALVSVEGLESYLQGASGAGVTIAGGRLGRNIIDRNSRNKVESDVKKIQSITEDLGKVSDPVVKNQMLESAGELASEVNQATNENNAILESLTPEQRQQAEQLTANIESITETLANDAESSSPMSPETREVLEQRREQLGTELDAIVSNIPESTNENIEGSGQVPVEDGQVAPVAEEAGATQGLVEQQEVPAGSRLFSEPVAGLTELSAQYKTNNSIDTPEGQPIRRLDRDRSARIADAYEAMEHNPNDPQVRESYEAMATETLQQFETIQEAGYTVELWDGEGEPYANSTAMLDDLRNNNHLYVLPTEAEFGETPITDQQRQENPLLRDSGITDANGRRMLVNDVFRFVHDVFGHGERGNSFGALGEENAWDVHARMYSDTARRAMTTETRGQNSWVNFGPHLRNAEGQVPRRGEEGFTPVTERPFAEQKIGLLPEEFSQLESVQQTEVVDDSGVQQTETFTETEQTELVNTVSQIQGVTDAPTFVNSIRNSLSDSNIRQNRISELEQRFQQRRERGNNLGIAQDPRQEAQYWADVTEYAILKIADGTIKTAKALAETLGIDVNNPNVQKAFTDAESINNIISEATVTPRRTTPAQNIRRATQGGVQGRESLTTRQALGNQMRTLNRGARDMAKNTRDLAGTISAYIQSQRNRLKGAKVSQTVVNRVANSVSGVTNEAQLNRALNVVEKYISDAEFRTKLNNIAGQQRSLKRASSQMPADRRRVVREFADINPIDLSASKLDNYLTIMQNAQRVAFADVGDVSNEQLQAYVDEAKLWGDKRVAERALEAEFREESPEYQKQRLKAKKKQLKELGLTDAEINDLIDPTKDFKEVLADLESERKELTHTRIEVLRNNAERLANTIKDNRSEIRATLKSASDRRLFDRLVNNLDISNLSDRKVLTANYVLHNVAVEGSMVGTLDLIASLDSANKLQKNTNFLATAFRDVGQAMWTYLNMPVFGAQGRIKIEALVKDSDIAGRLNVVTGFLDYTKSASRATNKVKDITKRSEKIATKHKGKWSDVNDKIKMSMHIITSQYRESWTPEQIQENYVGRWKAIAESYDRLVNDPSSYNRKVNAPLAERLRGFIQEDSSPETNPNALVRVIRDPETGRITEAIPLVTSEELFNQLPASYKEYYNFTRETFDANKEDFFSIREASDNKVLEKDWVNYYPLSYSTYNNKAGSATPSNASNTVDLREAPGRGRRSITGEASGAGNDRTLLGDRLPVGQIFNFQMLDTFLEDAGQMIYDTETTLDRWIVNETTDFRKNGLEDALKGTDSHIGAMEHYRVVVADKLQNDEFNLRLPTLNADVPLSHRLGMQLVQSIRNIGASVSLGSLMGAQRLKQTTPLVETLARLKNKKSFATAMKLIVDKDPRVKTLVEEATLALRDTIGTHLGLRSESRGVSEREYGLLASGTIKGVEGFSKLTEKLSGISLKELQNSDLDYATIGWLSMYIDKATEGGQPLDLDSVNDVAYAYAENQNEIIMNSSDKAMQGNYSKSEFLKAVAPMMSFSMNTVNSLILSIDRMMYYAKRGDMDKARYYAKEVVANYANAGLFQAISTAIRVGGLVAVKYIGEVAYDIILAWMEDDEEYEFKKERIMKIKEGSEEYQIQANNAIQRSLLNSGGYLINDLLSRGVLFGDAGSELGGFLAGVAYEKTLGKDYLDSVDWKPMRGFSRGGVAGAVDQVSGLTGIFGMGLGAMVNVGTDLGAVLETQEDFIKARRGFATAEGDDIVLNDFDLTEEGLLEYGKPFLAEQSEFLALTLSAVSMLGLSDQVINSFSRGIRASTKRTLNEVYGKGKSEAQLKKIMREVSNFSEITELGATYTPTPEELGKLKAEYLNNVAYYRKQLGAIPLKSEREDSIIKTARFKTIKEFYEKNPHVRETITKEIYKEVSKSTREGELLIKSMKADKGE